jgi:hypothetical protein
MEKTMKMTNDKRQMTNECQMTNTKLRNLGFVINLDFVIRNLRLKESVRLAVGGWRLARTENRRPLTEIGQALIELAVFGTFFLMILGVLLNYGLRYNYQQKAQMTAFRRALKIASDPNRGSGSAMVMEDHSIPDPSDMFGVGTVTPIIASASVQRDPMMNSQPVGADSLPVTLMDIQTKRNDATATQEWTRRFYKTAGFRIEGNYSVPVDDGATDKTTDKYENIFGSILADDGAGNWVSIHDPNATPKTKNGYYQAIRIIDACDGQIVDFDTCWAQSRQLVDVNFCIAKCKLAQTGVQGSATNCNTLCSRTTNPPNQSNPGYDSSKGGAWYAADYYKDAKGNYVFPHLNALFGLGAASTAASQPEPMGIQPDTTAVSTRAQALEKTETSNSIITQESGTWTDTSNRTLVHQENLQQTGPLAGFEIVHNQPGQFVNVKTEALPSEVSGQASQTAQTSK